jgi:hypothetical protein
MPWCILVSTARRNACQVPGFRQAHGALSRALATGGLHGRVRTLEEVSQREAEDDPRLRVDRQGPDTAFSQSGLVRLRRVKRLPDGGGT